MLTSDAIARARQTIEALRRRSANVKREELENLALSTGWRLNAKQRGEPRYEKPGRYPLSIPGHRAINKFTVRGILKQLEDNLDREEEELTHGA